MNDPNPRLNSHNQTSYFDKERVTLLSRRKDKL